VLLVSSGGSTSNAEVGGTNVGLTEDIDDAVKKVVQASWNSRNGAVVPTTEDVALSNGAVLLDAVYLYADMADSTGLARDFSRETAAKVIRAYLDATCRVIRARGGEIRSFDGDRVMAIFVGNAKNSAAAKCALNIKYVVDEIVRPAVDGRFPSLINRGFTLSHCVGIASGSALIVRGGVRGNNDLVSVGRAPNVAAKLSEIRNRPYRTYITAGVFSRLNEDSKYGGKDKRLMWEQRTRTVGGEEMTVYRSSWQWKP
jgi:adenylate cyclase